MVSQDPCPFCAPADARIVASSEHAVALRDRYPVSEGHTLIVSKHHVESLFDLPLAEQVDAWALVARVREALQEQFQPAGFTVGINDGSAAGQTVAHAHIHLIPRRAGDVPDPRGGIRLVMPERPPYWRVEGPGR